MGRDTCCGEMTGMIGDFLRHLRGTNLLWRRVADGDEGCRFEMKPLTCSWLDGDRYVWYNTINLRQRRKRACMDTDGSDYHSSHLICHLIVKAYLRC